jgi:hypothetical protein
VPPAAKLRQNRTTTLKRTSEAALPWLRPNVLHSPRRRRGGDSSTRRRSIGASPTEHGSRPGEHVAHASRAPCNYINTKVKTDLLGRRLRGT